MLNKTQTRESSPLTMDSHIFKPLSISGVKINNRLGLAPLNTGLIGESTTQEKCSKFYASYINSGIGLLSIGGIAISQQARVNRSSFVLDGSNDLQPIASIINEAHSQDVKISIQIEHAGRQANPKEIGYDIVAASPIKCPVVKEVPKALSKKEIAEIVTDFCNSALLAEQLNSDFVEVHAAHGYLISGFLSPYSNERKDEYGGDLENRFRILNEIIDSISSSCSIPIGVRMNCTDAVSGGIAINDVINGIRLIQDRISYISITAGVYSPNDTIMPSQKMGKALWSKQSKKIKSAIKIPVFLAGNIDSLKLAESLVTTSTADLFLFGRSLLADPLLIKKTLNNEQERILECTYCNLCKYHSGGYKHITCPYNRVLEEDIKSAGS